MNIHDTVAPEAPKSFAGILIVIFNEQAKLMEKYKYIEQLPDPPLPVHHKTAQKIIRDFAWRTTEELAESFEALFFKHPDDDSTAEHHALEELADAIHFYVELMIFAGITAEQCYHRLPMLYNRRTTSKLEVSTAYWNATFRIGIAMNFLRNKAWKQSHVPTDEARFRAAVLDGWVALMQVWETLGYTEHAIFNYYTRKAQVNQFRQRSNY